MNDIIFREVSFRVVRLKNATAVGLAVLLLLANDVCSTFCPVTTPFGDYIYFTDLPDVSKSGYTLTQCATQCAFIKVVSSGVSSSCQCFSYNKTSSDCSIYTTVPQSFDVDKSENTIAYQLSDQRLTVTGAWWPTVSPSQCDFPFEYRGQLYHDCRYKARRTESSCETGNFGCCMPTGRMAYCNPSAVSSTQFGTNSPGIGYVDAMNCSFPFTYKNRLYYSCSSDVSNATDGCHRYACYKEGRVLARCKPPADYVAQITNFTVSITGLVDRVTLSVFGWISFMLRETVSGDGNWNLYWDSYVNGFGSTATYMWLGLERIYQLNKKGQWKLRMEYQYGNGNWRSAEYSTFRLSSSAYGYSIYISGFSGDDKELLSDSNNVKFTTSDKDNDNKWPGSCISVWGGVGPWWYNNCGYVYLTASQPFLTPPTDYYQLNVRSAHLMIKLL